MSKRLLEQQLLYVIRSGITHDVDLIFGDPRHARFSRRTFSQFCFVYLAQSTVNQGPGFSAISVCQTTANKLRRRFGLKEEIERRSQLRAADNSAPFRETPRFSRRRARRFFIPDTNAGRSRHDRYFSHCITGVGRRAQARLGEIRQRAAAAPAINPRDRTGSGCPGSGLAITRTVRDLVDSRSKLSPVGRPDGRRQADGRTATSRSTDTATTGAVDNVMWTLCGVDTTTTACGVDIVSTFSVDTATSTT